jgi:hypothetical protein
MHGIVVVSNGLKSVNIELGSRSVNPASRLGSACGCECVACIAKPGNVSAAGIAAADPVAAFFFMCIKVVGEKVPFPGT